jgi:hypothetical protein
MWCSRSSITSWRSSGTIRIAPSPVLLPELVERQWYQYFLHNQRAQILAARLLTQGTHRIVIVNVPWYLRKRR